VSLKTLKHAVTLRVFDAVTTGVRGEWSCAVDGEGFYRWTKRPAFGSAFSFARRLSNPPFSVRPWRRRLVN